MPPATGSSATTTRRSSIIQAIVQNGVEQGSQEEAYLSDALVAVGTYLKTGIPGTPVAANPQLAQEYFRTQRPISAIPRPSLS
jgi:hypothetical protein